MTTAAKTPLPRQDGNFRQQEFLEHYGNICPNCARCNHVRPLGAPVDNTDGIIFYPAGCTHCGATWKAVYEVQEYYDLQLR